MKKIFQILLFVSAGLLLNSCYYDALVERPIDEKPTDPDDPDYVEYSYENDIQPIWNSKCTACHKAGSTNPVLEENVSYNNIVPEYVYEQDAEGSPLYQKLQTGDHAGRADTEEMAYIKAWINQGAQDN